jgi:Methyltransferase domain
MMPELVMRDIYSENDIFQTYFERAPEKTWVVESFSNRLHFSSNKAMILDAGCHDGKLMQRIVRQYYDILPEHTTIIGVDPCEAAIAKFNKIDFGSKVTARGYAMSIEQFLNKNDTRFDWIIASQSLYWTQDLKKIIRQIADASANALIVLRGKTGIFQIQKTFPELIGNKQEQLYNAEHINDALLQLQINFKREDKATYIPLPDIDSAAYTHLLNFFMQTGSGQLLSEDIRRINEFISATFQDKIRHDVTQFLIFTNPGPD